MWPLLPLLDTLSPSSCNIRLKRLFGKIFNTVYKRFEEISKRENMIYFRSNCPIYLAKDLSEPRPKRVKSTR